MLKCASYRRCIPKVVGSRKKVTTAHSPYLLTKKNGRSSKCWVLYQKQFWMMIMLLSYIKYFCLNEALSQLPYKCFKWEQLTRIFSDAPLLSLNNLMNIYPLFQFHAQYTHHCSWNQFRFISSSVKYCNVASMHLISIFFHAISTNATLRDCEGNSITDITIIMSRHLLVHVLLSSCFYCYTSSRFE